MPKKYFQFFITFALLIFFFSGCEQDIKPDKLNGNKISDTVYPVTQIIDGDTIEVKIDGQKERVRLLGIDTPEIDWEKMEDECQGFAARSKLDELLFERQVTMKNDPTQADQDEYGRLLRYLWLPDGTFVNQKLIELGLAREYTFKKQSYQYQKIFRSAETEARAKQLGIWSNKNCQ